MVLSYAQNPEVSGDLGALSEDLHHLSAGAEPESSGSTLGQGQTSGQGQDVEWVTPSKRKARQLTSHSIFEADISKQRLVYDFLCNSLRHIFIVCGNKIFFLLKIVSW